MDQTSLREELRCAWLIAKWAGEKILALTAFVAAIEIWLVLAGAR